MKDYCKILNEIAAAFDMDQWNDQMNNFTGTIKKSVEPSFWKISPLLYDYEDEERGSNGISCIKYDWLNSLNFQIEDYIDEETEEVLEEGCEYYPFYLDREYYLGNTTNIDEEWWNKLLGGTEYDEYVHWYIDKWFEETEEDRSLYDKWPEIRYYFIGCKEYLYDDIHDWERRSGCWSLEDFFFENNYKKIKTWNSPWKYSPYRIVDLYISNDDRRKIVMVGHSQDIPVQERYSNAICIDFIFTKIDDDYIN